MTQENKTDNARELKECPFCGSGIYHNAAHTKVGCANDDCELSSFWFSAHTWNTRAITPSHEAALARVTEERDFLRNEREKWMNNYDHLFEASVKLHARIAELEAKPTVPMVSEEDVKNLIEAARSAQRNVYCCKVQWDMLENAILRCLNPRVIDCHTHGVQAVNQYDKCSKCETSTFASVIAKTGG